MRSSSRKKCGILGQVLFLAFRFFIPLYNLPQISTLVAAIRHGRRIEACERDCESGRRVGKVGSCGLPFRAGCNGAAFFSVVFFGCRKKSASPVGATTHSTETSDSEKVAHMH